MQQLLLIGTISAFILATNGGWADPPGIQVSWGPPGINVTWDGVEETLYVTMMENTGIDWDFEKQLMPYVEFKIDNDSESVGWWTGWSHMDLEHIDDRWYFSLLHPLDADDDRSWWTLKIVSKPEETLLFMNVTAIDYNDEIPQWENGDFSNMTIEVEETEEWGEEGDSASSSRRQIAELTFSDKDKEMTRFTVEKDNPDCRKVLSKAICDEVLELIEVDVPYEIVGRALVRRTKGQLIDLDDRRLFDGDSNEHHYLLTVWDTDKTNSITSNFTMVVKRRED